MANCKKCGKELGKRQTVFCSNACKLSDKDNIYTRTRKIKVNAKNVALKSKIDGKIIKDVNNISGTVTRYLLKHGIDVGQSYQEYFDVIELEEVPVYKSKYSDWTTKDITNKSGWITVEVKKHTTIEKHLEKYPEEAYLFKVDVRNLKYMNDGEDRIECKVCGQKMKFVSELHLRKHGLTTFEYKLKYGFPPIFGKDSINKLKKSYIENESINKKQHRSKPELEIEEFLKDNNIEYFNNSREFTDGHEIDFIIPEYNLAIEYNGLYYHSEIMGGKDKNYHINKMNICNRVGLRLITIFEDEWLNNKDLIISKLKNQLNLVTNKIYARKCTIKEISASESNLFLDTNHNQGKCQSTIKLGAFYNEELVGVMTFSNGRVALGSKRVDGEYEMIRYSTILNHSCVGLFSKMLNYFIKTYSPTVINSYGDLRWIDVNKNVYLSNGFTLSSISRPNYWYTYRHKNRIHRYNFRKHKLLEMGGDASKSEWEIMKELHYDRIWDCGNGKYTLKLN